MKVDNKVFFEDVHESIFHGHMNDKQVAGCQTILEAFAVYASPTHDCRHLAYILATAYHETAHTMTPIAEYGHGRGHPYGRPGPDGQCAYGRGYVQLTWRENYEHADEKLGLKGELAKNFNLALQPDIAARILIYGMLEAWFTKYKLEDYFNDQTTDWVHARRIINGMDCAELIAGYARHFYTALAAADPNG